MNPLGQLIKNLSVKPNVKQREDVKIVIPVSENPDAVKIGEPTEPKPLISGEPKIQKIAFIDKRDVGFNIADVKKNLQNKKKVVTTINPSVLLQQEPEKPIAVVEPQPIEPAPAPIVPVPAPVVKKPGRPKKLLIIQDDAVKEPEPNPAQAQPDAVKPVIKKMGKKKLLIIQDDDEGKKPDEGTKEPGPVIEPIPVPTIQEPGLEPVKKTKGRRTKKIAQGVSILNPEDWVNIDDESIIPHMPQPKPRYNIKVSSYYMNNRENFVNFINSTFNPYRQELLSEDSPITCETIGKNTDDAELLTHQKLVRDYLNLVTPYRGLLLFHALGSGKTASSIAIAEGMKSEKKIIVMTPASLEDNYMSELKKHGDTIYKKNKFWKWISIKDHPDALDTLSSALNLSVDYINRQEGAWLIDITKETNYNSLNPEEKTSLESQINEMILTKYKFIHYNGLRRDKLKEMTNNFENNIFDNAVIVIDEAHNFISRVVNKIEKEKKIGVDKKGKRERVSYSLSLILYDLLMSAQNAKVVLLTGTPIINYPNEIGILFNILRGYIKTWEISLDVSRITGKIGNDTFETILARENNLDYINYSPASKKLIVTRNPFGFTTTIKREPGKPAKYNGVTSDTIQKVITDDEFERNIVRLLQDNNIQVAPQGISIQLNKALPDKLVDFINMFITPATGDIKNVEMFKKRIMGLTSYFRSAQEKLLPRYEKIQNYHVIKIPMSDYQFGVYENAREQERKNEKSSKTKKGKVDENGIYKEPSSTYRIFSRLYCNFAMPNPPGRPLPKISKTEVGEAGEGETKAKGGVGEEVEGAMARKDVEEETEDEEERQDEEETTEGEETEGENEEKDKKGEAKEGEEDKKKVKRGRKKKEDSGTGEKTMLEENYEEALKLVKNPEKETNLEDDVTEGDEIIEKNADATYEIRKRDAMNYLRDHAHDILSPDGLEIYSPKFLHMLENIQDPDNIGLHLIYSQFRSLEGIGIFKMVLEHNGYTQFKIKKNAVGLWEMDISLENKGKPTFALYTGTESKEEKDILRNIYNGDWDYLNVAPSLLDEIKQTALNNNTGEIIKVFMITSSGSEGINLRNTRFVHIMEPYWHPVRTEQVIGRARRICSHKNLPEELQTVDVFLYLMTFSKEQLSSDASTELKTKDLSKEMYKVITNPGKPEKFVMKKIPFTSDETLYEISSIKEQVNLKIITAIKEASIDCAIYSKRGSGETLHCLQFGNPNSRAFSFNPSLTSDETDSVQTINKKKIEWTGVSVTIIGKQYIYRKMDSRIGYIYDYESYNQALETPGIEPVLIGTLEKNEKGQQVFKPLYS
jgi:hypothetical protein